MEFEDGQTCSFNMVAFSERICARQTKIYGTKGLFPPCLFSNCCGSDRLLLACVCVGELVCDGSDIRHFDFLSEEQKLYTGVECPTNTRLKGHDGADFYLMDSFITAVATNNPSLILSGYVFVVE